MLIKIRGKAITVNDKNKSYIEETLEAAISKYFAQAIEADVAFSKEGSVVKADINVKVSKHSRVHGTETSSDMLAAFDMALAHVTKQLRRYKRHLNNHHKKLDSSLEFESAKQYVLSSEAEDETGQVKDEPLIVAEVVAEIPKLTVADAVMKLDLENLSVLTFINKAHGQVNVVYRRNDGHYGWVDPQLK